MFAKIIFHTRFGADAAHPHKVKTGRAPLVSGSTCRPHIWCRLTYALLFTALACTLPTSALAQKDERSAGGVYERSIPLIGSSDRRLTLFLKLPPGARTGADVAGVFAFCTWESKPESIRAVLTESDGTQPGGGVGARIMRYAARHNLAVVSWTTFNSANLVDRQRSFDEMSRREAAQFDRAFDQVARTWKRGVEDFIRDYQLPKEKWLLYGMSRGGQWAHRIALREPGFFAAVHVHINSSYDRPVPEASSVWWLVTTGELEAGYPAARRFYAASRALNYPMIFHAEPKLGHENHPNIDRLSNAFFDHVIANLKAAAAGQPAPQTERFVGNYFTHEFVPWAKGAQMPEAFRVILPSRDIAEAWGLEAEED